MEPEQKAKFTVLKSDDPKAQILYQELEFGNYILFTEESLNDDRNEALNEEASCKEDSSGIWTLEFDGSCSSSGFGVGIVLIPP